MNENTEIEFAISIVTINRDKDGDLVRTHHFREHIDDLLDLTILDKVRTRLVKKLLKKYPVK